MANRNPSWKQEKKIKNSKSNQRPNQRLAEHEEKNHEQGGKKHDGKSGKLVSVILINGCNNLVWKGPVCELGTNQHELFVVSRKAENKGDGGMRSNTRKRWTVLDYIGSSYYYISYSTTAGFVNEKTNVHS